MTANALKGITIARGDFSVDRGRKATHPIAGNGSPPIGGGK